MALRFEQKSFVGLHMLLKESANVTLKISNLLYKGYGCPLRKRNGLSVST